MSHGLFGVPSSSGSWSPWSFFSSRWPRAFCRRAHRDDWCWPSSSWLGSRRCVLLPGLWTRAPHHRGHRRRGRDRPRRDSRLSAHRRSAFCRTFGTYTNRWLEIGGGSNWWYHPVWWMVGTFIPWMGAWLLANRTARTSGRPRPRRLRDRDRVHRRPGRSRGRDRDPSAPGWNLGTFGVAVPPRDRAGHRPLRTGIAPRLIRCAGSVSSSVSSDGCSRRFSRGQLHFSGPWAARLSPCKCRIPCRDSQSPHCAGHSPVSLLLSYGFDTFAKRPRHEKCWRLPRTERRTPSSLVIPARSE